jgi:hypothetical protein
MATISPNGVTRFCKCFVLFLNRVFVTAPLHVRDTVPGASIFRTPALAIKFEIV